MADHPDFQSLPWAKRLLSDPNLTIIPEVPETDRQGMAPNTMFNTILYQPGAINAHVSFRRPCTEPDAPRGDEQCMLLSVGHNVDGMVGRAHGGFNSLILDQLCGGAAYHAVPNAIPPATATLTVDYKAPVSTPCVVLARAWMTEIAGRKLWVRGVLEDGEGKVLASGKALFIAGRSSVL
ncbi:hypothetical protein B0A55_01242 [Friedmanniomyces simplex]|uniref:Thioesterase domain-containing protein n=1 Tax=Friedmanniomyces simplex TaxID=329884 RepID=A0A4U0Y197_9PEZI|nr:hypothetical protein B0A55_01242 [Friedmanniomyces simplex]